MMAEIYKNKVRHACLSAAIAALGIMLLCGCVQKPFTRENADITQVKRIAVLPFENFTSDPYAGEKIRRIVITELLARGTDVVEPGEVTRLLIDMEVRSLRSIKITDIQEIGKKLNVDAIMTGSVEAFGISRGISVSYPEVTINLMLLETSSGNIIWSVHQSTGGPSFWTRHFGSEGISLSEAANETVTEAIGKLH